ncbi:MAG: hypothetical protein ABIJ18_02555 [archaeon]
MKPLKVLFTEQEILLIQSEIDRGKNYTEIHKTHFSNISYPTFYGRFQDYRDCFEIPSGWPKYKISRSRKQRGKFTEQQLLQMQEKIDNGELKIKGLHETFFSNWTYSRFVYAFDYYKCCFDIPEDFGKKGVRLGAIQLRSIRQSIVEEACRCGHLTLEQIAIREERDTKTPITREGVRLYIKKTGNVERFKQARRVFKKRVKQAREDREENDKKLTGEVFMSLYDQIEEDALRFAVQYVLKHNDSKTSSLSKLIKLFRLGQELTDEGKIKSYKEIGEEVGLSTMTVRRIYNELECVPGNPSIARYSSELVERIEKAFEYDGLNMSTKAYLLDKSLGSIQQRFTRLGQHPKSPRTILNRGANRRLNYTMCSKLYEVMDMDTEQELTPQDLMGLTGIKSEDLLDYALEHRAEIAKELTDFLTHVEQRTITTPYRS